ncbi:STAS domain-containing protein [Streptomyces sp. NPDC085946]|uniref:STAS domain-containing protein n=1 Tax=Streptomyces sp. NPDC085946 TaxID=3365744 RepID=UPI0037D10E45
MTFLPPPTEPRDHPGRVLLALPHEIDACNATELLALIMSAARARAERLRVLVLDFSTTSFMDSQGVRLVNDVRTLLYPGARVLVVAEADGVPSRVLELTGLRRDVPVYDNLPEALAA